MDFPSRYQFEEEEFLDRIVTVDKTWVAYVNPETKQQSIQRGHTAYPSTPKKYTLLTAAMIWT